MINTVEITTLYTALTDSVANKLDALYTADKIDAETYAKILAQSFDEALKLAVSAVQQQVQIDKDLEVKDAQIAQTGQQTINLMAEGLNIPKQGELIDAQTNKMVKDGLIADEEVLVKKQQVQVAIAEVGIAQAKLANIPKEGDLVVAQTSKVLKDVELADQEIAVAVQKVLVAIEEVAVARAKLANIPKEGALLDAQALKLGKDKLLVEQQTLNAVTEKLVLLANECKIKAEFDVLVLTKDKVVQETVLMAQKALTERAQTTAAGVDADSVIGKQKALYQAQSTGFTRDAEQKAASVLVDAWKIQRTTDSEGIGGNSTNRLDDSNVGQAVAKLLSGVGL